MKNTIKLLGIIAIVAIIGFSFAGCDNGSTDTGGGNWDGVWRGTAQGYGAATFTVSGNFTKFVFEVPVNEFRFPENGTGTIGETEEKLGGFNVVFWETPLFIGDEEVGHITYRNEEYQGRPCANLSLKSESLGLGPTPYWLNIFIVKD